VREVEKLAAKKGVTPAQVALGWVLAQSKSNGADIVPIPGATTPERIKENMNPAQLSEEDLAEIADILKKCPVVGDRYHPEAMKHIEA
jgi:pyridoxine 4-dehydrogenase